MASSSRFDNKADKRSKVNTSIYLKIKIRDKFNLCNHKDRKVGSMAYSVRR